MSMIILPHRNETTINKKEINMFTQAVITRENGRKLRRTVNETCKHLKAKDPVRDTDGVWIVRFGFPTVLSMPKR